MKRKRSQKKNNKKKIIIILVIILILLLLISGVCYFYFYKKGINYKSKLEIEVGEAVPVVKDYVSEKDVDKVSDEIKWKELEIEDGKVYRSGEYEGIITYRDEEIILKLFVTDTKAPVIEGIKDIEMTAFEEEPDLMENITATDNSNEKIEVQLLGEYDPEKAGTYELYYYAKDSNNNKTKVAFKFVVNENENVKLSKSDNGYVIKNYYGVTYVDDVVLVNKTYSLPSNFAPNNLVSINGYIKVVDYVKEAFDELKSDASSIGLNIYASSGYRSYSDQNYIYNRYVEIDGKENADTYSARAGHSEHQTGLAIDLNTVDSSFDGTSESNWLRDNCYKYGFIIRYPKGKENITGYIYEPWHIRYVGKTLASKLYNNGSWITMEEYYGVSSKYS